jgi:DivIVA domain-containing protein
VDFDRQAIERRDFPIARRGYDTAAVDAHLRALAAEIEELSRRPEGEPEPTLAATASAQVQSILHAAETAAAEIESDAAQRAQEVRDEADRDAEAMRDQAITQARAHVTAVSQTAALLLERVSSMDSEVSSLVEGLRAGASMLAGDLAAVDRNMADLYDGAARRAQEAPPARERITGAVQGRAAAPPIAPPPAASAQYEEEGLYEGEEEEEMEEVELATAPVNGELADTGASDEQAGDVDGARLIALNMALNGDSRADTDRYLAEHFELADRQRLIDEVYAAVEG